MRKIMIADDEPKIRAGIKMLIEGFDLNMEVCAEAKNGTEALKMAEEVHPNIILLDICMPRLSGLQFLKELKAKELQCMVIIISGFDDFKYAKEAIEYGVFAYLLKPLVEDELYNTLRNVDEKLRKREDEEEVLKVMNYKNSPESSARTLATEAKKYICEHFREPDLNLGVLADQLNSNPAYISRMMKKEFGVSFKDFLTKLRTTVAVEMMKNSNLSIGEIAEQVGYNSQHYFSAAFKNTRCISPSGYRKGLLHEDEEKEAP